MTKGRAILTTQAMRAAEQAAIASGYDETVLTERAGAALAEAVTRYAGDLPALVLCGPGNNGGDGYVAARHLAERGIHVRIAAWSEPSSASAKWARSGWAGKVEPLDDSTAAAPLLIDCLFGTGLKRALEPDLLGSFLRLANAARVKVACDVPSGIDSDGGAALNPMPRFDLTVAFGALKPAHRLAPALHICGRVAVADIGIDAASDWFEIARPILSPVAPDAHKYSRGLVHCLAGEMPGAIALAATAAARSGAGYVRISTSERIEGLPASIVQLGSADLSDERIGCLIVGPGMGDLPQVLTLALTSKAPKVIDADALRHIGDTSRLHGQDAILTPHAGEFDALFGPSKAPKLERALEAARSSKSVVVFKGPDTLVAAPDGRLGFAPPAPAWLASAGTGDVLAGMVAALRARGLDSFDAACAAVWLHGRAAELAAPGMIADDLAVAIPRVLHG